MILSRTYYAVPGMHTFYVPSLYNVKLLQVARSGLIYTEIDSEASPSGMEFKRDDILGLVFDSNNPFNNLETITALWEGTEIIEY